MHRATPANSSFRAYVAGGARATVNSIDDTKLMQEHASDFMINESRSKIESPQNYGFTSVVAAATKDAMGKVTGCAETFISFMGGNRSFPVAGNMDDRRHRLKGLASGDTAMFRQKDDKQQFHMTTDGGFWTAPQDKTVRMALINQNSGSQQQQQQQSVGVEAQDSSGGAGGSSSSSGAGGQNGQQSLKSSNQQSQQFVDVTGSATRSSGTNVHLIQKQAGILVHVADDQNVYLGGEKGKHLFDKVMTASGPATNVFARID